MVTIQSDEYGDGVAAEMHSSLFADAMTALDLDPTYGAYLDRLPAVTLATTNLISMFGSAPQAPRSAGRTSRQFRDELGGPDGPLQFVARIARCADRRSAVL